MIPPSVSLELFFVPLTLSRFLSCLQLQAAALLAQMSGEVGAQSDSAPLYPVAMDLLMSLAMMGRRRWRRS